MNLQALDKFHNTRWGHLVFGLVELLMGYGFVNWALGTGALWWWAIAAALLAGGLHNIWLAVWSPESRTSSARTNVRKGRQ